MTSRPPTYRLAVLFPLLLAASVGLARAGTWTPSPADWRDQSVYQIMTDRFFDGDPSNNAIEGSYDPTDGARIHGGDWAGAEQKLDYIAGLGATAIWISPVQTNAFAAYHGYHIQDFYGFAPHNGGITALRSFVDAAHARGMFVILDVIANHGGDLIDSGDPGWPAYEDPGTYTLRWRNASNKAAPPFDDLSMYHNNGAIDDFIDPNQILGELFGLDDLKTEDPAVRQELIAAHQWLIRETDCDGFRIDTVKHVELDFWQDFGPAVRSFAADSLGKTNFLMYGEIFDGSSFKNGTYTGTQAGGAFALDSVLWFPMKFASNGVFLYGAPPSSFSAIYADSVLYDPAARNRLMNFLDNHDVARFMGFGSPGSQDDARLRAALAWQHTSLGIPIVYYGTEQEFDGGGDPYNREDMWDGQWDFGPSEDDNFDMTAPLYRTLRRLNELRDEYPALRTGSLVELFVEGSGPGLYAYERRLGGEKTVLVVVNTSESADTLTFDPGFPAGSMVDVLTGRTVDVPGAGPIDLAAGGLSSAIFVTDPPDFAPWVEAAWPPHDGVLSAADGEVRLTFTQFMDRASVESVLSITPSFAYTTAWAGRTLILRPSAPLPNGATYGLWLGGTARDVAGRPLGEAFSTFFRVDTTPGPVTVSPPWTAIALSGADLFVPLALERGSGGTRFEGRLLLGDTGWDRLFTYHDRGFVENVLDDDSITRPAAIAQDRAGGIFSGDILFTNSDEVLRLPLDGEGGGAPQAFAILPGSNLSWALAIDPGGAYGGRAFVGRPSQGTLWEIDAAGVRTTFAAGLGAGVSGVAFDPTGAFGGKLHVSDPDGSVRTVDPDGSSALFASSSLLDGAAALAFDPVGNFGHDLFIANTTFQSILRIGPGGQISTFASGFSSLDGGDGLAFDARGDLYAVESGTSGTARVVKILAARTDSVVTTAPVPGESGLTSIVPNPFSSRTELRWVVPAGEAVPVRLAVYDVAGREVRTLVNERQEEGPSRAVWDGRDESGSRLASGVYFVKLRVADRESVRKVVRIR